MLARVSWRRKEEPPVVPGAALCNLGKFCWCNPVCRTGIGVRRLKGRVLGAREETNTQPDSSSSPQPVFDSTRLASGLSGAQAPRLRPRWKTLVALIVCEASDGRGQRMGGREIEDDSQKGGGIVTFAVRVAAARRPWWSVHHCHTRVF